MQRSTVTYRTISRLFPHFGWLWREDQYQRQIVAIRMQVTMQGLDAQPLKHIYLMKHVLMRDR